MWIKAIYYFVHEKKTTFHIYNRLHTRTWETFKNE